MACGNEIKSVVNAGRRFDRYPMGRIDSTHMWQVRCMHPTTVEPQLAGLLVWTAMQYSQQLWMRGAMMLDSLVRQMAASPP